MGQFFLKIERLFFYFLLFVLPFQTRRILYQWFIPQSLGREGGGFNEWNSAFLYFTDLLIFGILSLWIFRLFIARFFPRKSTPLDSKHLTGPSGHLSLSICFLLPLFFIFGGASLIGASNLGLASYQLIKLLEFLALFFYIRFNLLDSKHLKGLAQFFDFKKVLAILVLSGLFQAFIGIGQFTFQSDLGLKLFGESPLGPNIEGAAKIVVSGIRMIRVYGTFPHPNVFAAFLLLSIFSFYIFYLKLEKPTFETKLISLGIFTFLVFALFLTFSRISIFLFLFLSVFLFLHLFFKKELYNLYHQKTLLISSLFLLAVILCGILMIPELYSRFVEGAVDPGIQLRFFYNEIALSMIKESPLFGIGLGNFVWRLQDFQGSLGDANLIYKLDVPETKIVPFRVPDWLYQPVHNVYLLIASEVGIFGLLVFLVFLGFVISPIFKILKENNLFFIFYFLFFIFIALAMTDHFFWTLQQGKLIFWLVLGILASFSYCPSRT